MTITLTPRQYEVAQLVAQGLSGREIAAQLCVTESTVKNHLMKVYQRLGLHTQAGSKRVALRAALETGWVQPKEGASAPLGFELVYYAGVIRVDRREPRPFVRERLIRAFAAMLDRRLDAVYGVEQEAAA